MKRCGECHRELDESCFSRQVGNKDGLYPYCKECSRRKTREWREANLERAREKDRKWYGANRERARTADRKWKEDNSERVKEYHRKYRDGHRERLKEYKHRRRARKAGSMGSFTADEWLALCEKYGNTCLACGEQKPLAADHVKPIARGGTSNIGNIQPLCKSCNSKKGAKEIDYRAGIFSK